MYCMFIAVSRSVIRSNKKDKEVSNIVFTVIRKNLAWSWLTLRLYWHVSLTKLFITRLAALGHDSCHSAIGHCTASQDSDKRANWTAVLQTNQKFHHKFYENRFMRLSSSSDSYRQSFFPGLWGTGMRSPPKSLSCPQWSSSREPSLRKPTPIECAVSYPQPHSDANWIRHQQLNVYNESAFVSSLKPFKNGS